jgi:hypothetical protein
MKLVRNSILQHMPKVCMWNNTSLEAAGTCTCNLYWSWSSWVPTKYIHPHMYIYVCTYMQIIHICMHASCVWPHACWSQSVCMHRTVYAFLCCGQKIQLRSSMCSTLQRCNKMRMLRTQDEYSHICAAILWYTLFYITCYHVFMQIIIIEHATSRATIRSCR